jgi:hypothetical protein
MNWNLMITSFLLMTPLMGISAEAKDRTEPNLCLIDADGAKSVIVLPFDATEGEKYAATELRDNLKLISDVELAIISETEYSPARGTVISIGRTNFSKTCITDEQLASLGDDGYLIRVAKNQVFFLGGRKRGSIYAVYDYLESLGVRWYAPEYTVIPKIAVLRLPKETEFKPKFWYRDQYWNNSPDFSWLVRMRVNGDHGSHRKIPETLGGAIVSRLGCHSYDQLVPPSKYFAAHPEWFSLKENGQRTAGELCLTNPELREFVAQAVIDDLRQCPSNIANYWVSQNDGGGPGCFCEKCTAERLAHGGVESWSANTISFTNYVAEKVKTEFPKVKIKTLAYNYTKTPPSHMKAADNVLVEICGNFREVGDDQHSRLIAAWSKVASNISVYVYGGSNFGYWWPYPNIPHVGLQYSLADQVGVTSFYMQGTAIGKGAGFMDLRAYLCARMAWDPSRDVQKEIRAFCNGFYGPGSKYLVEYINWYYQYCRQRKMKVDSGWGDAEVWRNWVTKEAMDKGEELFNKALIATQDNAVYYAHVRQAYLEVLWGSIMINTKPGTDLMNKDLDLLPSVDPVVIRQKARLYGEIMRENGYNMILENVRYDPAKYPY